MAMLGAALVPHPPVILHEVGKGREQGIQSTIKAYRDAAAQVARWNPDVLVISSPHTQLYADYFHISPGAGAQGGFSEFGAPQVRLSAVYDGQLASQISFIARRAGIQAGTLGERSAALDHGTMIPLYFLRQAGIECPVLRIGLSGFPPITHYRLGKCVAEAAQALGRRAVFVASGDLSHKLTPDGPYGFDPHGPRFDREVTRALDSGDFLRLLTLEPDLCGAAAECGLRPLQMMAGALDGLCVQPQLLSYEGPFGVGYAVAVFTPTGQRSQARQLENAYLTAQRKRMEEVRQKEDPFVRLARNALETALLSGHPPQTLPEGLPGGLAAARAGVFVSLHQNGRLRGCIGTIAPVTGCVASEIVRNAVCAGTEDPRFEPVSPDDLESLEYSVDVLSAPEPVDSPQALDVKRFGVIVSCGRRRGLLLPDLDGVDTVERQIAIARKKGGIEPHEPYTLQRFEVVRHT